MLKLTIDGRNYKIRFSTLVITDSDIITKILEDSASRAQAAVSIESKRAAFIDEAEKAKKENRDPDIDLSEMESAVVDMYKSLYDSALNSMRITAELLAAGLQKYHRDEYGYYIDDPDDPEGLPTVDDKLKSRVIRKCYDLIDSYEDDATDEQREKGEHDSLELYGLLNQELERNGFLSQVSRVTAQTEETVDSTVVPQDHKRKKPTKRQMDLSIGVPMRTIYFSSPNALNPYVDAYRRRKQSADNDMWTMGIYVQSAVFTAVAGALNGRKSRAKYISEPLSTTAEKREAEEEFYRQRGTEKGIEDFKIFAEIFNAGFDRKTKERSEG